jgi:hypothetical protein
MSSAAQNAANTANAQHSTGPRSEAGKAASAKNSVVFGLFSGDFVRPGEEHAYSALAAALNLDLAPVGPLEEILAEQIQRAAWRLRRCGEVESHLVLFLNDGTNFILDPMETSDPSANRIQRSVDRSRSQAHRLLHKSTAELRKLQTERRSRPEEIVPEATEIPKADPIPPANEPITQQTQSEPAATPRNAPCPCKSGQKYKRCCGKDAPAVLHAA